MNINWEYYRIFYQVAKVGSVSAASKILLNSQPNLTRTVKNLENELGCKLFSRTNRGMLLTEEGEKLYRHLQVAFAQIENGEKEIESAKAMESGSVSLAVTEVALRCFLLPILKEYRSRYPAVRLRIGNDLSRAALERLKSGSTDFAVITLSAYSRFFHEEKKNFIYRKIGELEEVAVVYGRSEQKRKETLAELSSYPLISLKEDTETYLTYQTFFAEHGLPFSPEIEAATADQILPLVKAELGVGFVPRAFLTEEKDVLVLETEEALPKRELYLVKRKDVLQSVASRKLEELIIGY